MIVAYIWNMDFMMYKSAGGIPFIKGISQELYAKGEGWITTPIMLGVYFAAFIVVSIL